MAQAYPPPYQGPYYGQPAMNGGQQQQQQQQQMGGYGGGMMMQQQQQQQTTVVVSQPGGSAPPGAPQNIREWSTGICGCCADLTSCLCGFFCYPCHMCRVAAKMNENCCVPLFLQGGLVAMRTKVRTQFGIRGSICGDWCCMTFCPQLALCQMDRELQHFGL